MRRRLEQSAVAVLAALLVGMVATPGLRAQETPAQQSPAQQFPTQQSPTQQSPTQDVAVEAAVPDSAPSAALVRISGDAAALEVHVHQSTVADVLSALGRFNIRYRASGALNEAIDGVYAGSLGRVLSRVLSGYDYAIKSGNDKLEVIIVGRSGDRAVPAPIVIPVRRRPSD